MHRHRRNKKQGPSYGSKLSIPRHRVLSRASADRLERAIERVERRAAKEACFEGQQEIEPRRDAGGLMPALFKKGDQVRAVDGDRTMRGRVMWDCRPDETVPVWWTGGVLNYEGHRGWMQTDEITLESA